MNCFTKEERAHLRYGETGHFGSWSPKAVCLCGSTRFVQEFQEAERDVTLMGHICLSVGLSGHQEGMDMEGNTKFMLDRLHLKKIEKSSEIWVINKDDYVGQSTNRAICYARLLGRGVRWRFTHMPREEEGEWQRVCADCLEPVYLETVQRAWEMLRDDPVLFRGLARIGE